MKKTWLFLFALIISASVFAQNEHNIVSEGNIIHFKTFGEGLPILIINGGPGMNSEGFIPLAKIFGKSNKAIIYDQRGTGKSEIDTVNANTITLDHMIDDIEKIRKHLDIKDWVVFGHSFGGMLASYYATKFPDNIKGLILSSSGGVDMALLANLNITSRLTTVEQDSLNFWNARIADGDTSYDAALQRGKYLAPAYLHDKSHVNTIAKRLTQGNMAINGLVWQNMRKIGFDCKKSLKNYSDPVLIIQGEQDVVDKQISQAAHDIFSNSELVFIPECGHYAWLEQPDLYFEKINSFLRSIKS